MKLVSVAKSILNWLKLYPINREFYYFFSILMTLQLHKMWKYLEYKQPVYSMYFMGAFNLAATQESNTYDRIYLYNEYSLRFFFSINSASKKI